jgi:hypothetical protein
MRSLVSSLDLQPESVPRMTLQIEGAIHSLYLLSRVSRLATLGVGWRSPS